MKKGIAKYSDNIHPGSDEPVVFTRLSSLTLFFGVLGSASILLPFE
jgi:hypothetical protein